MAAALVTKPLPGEDFADPWQTYGRWALANGVGWVHVCANGVVIDEGDGIRSPVVGERATVNGERIHAPRSTSKSRARHLELLAGLEPVLGIRADVRPEGRPPGRAVYDRACRWIDERPAGETFSERVRKAVKIIAGADPAAVLACDRTTLGDEDEHRCEETLRRRYFRRRRSVRLETVIGAQVHRADVNDDARTR